VIEQAIDTAALMLGSDKSRGYCLEMICADFLAGAHIENGNPKILLFSMLRLFRFLPAAQKQEFLTTSSEKRRRIRLHADAYHTLRRNILERDRWRCQKCGSRTNLEVHHSQFRSRQGDDSEHNLITGVTTVTERFTADGKSGGHRLQTADCELHRSVRSVISGGQLKRIGSRIVPIPRLVYSLSAPTCRSPRGYFRANRGR